MEGDLWFSWMGEEMRSFIRLVVSPLRSHRPPFPTTTAKHSAGNGLMVESRWSPFADTQWTYRGEGNANLVISLPQEKIIFRFHKLEYNLEVDVGTIKQEEDKVKRDVQFSNAITDKFIGIAYVQPPHYAKLPDDDAVKLDNEVLKMRPSSPGYASSRALKKHPVPWEDSHYLKMSYVSLIGFCPS
ncbi:hypothetical protein AAG570_012879 [Ranatra chinensis]|uniref:Inositol-pentakisphosphate 2-kinase n=1 Tax=Ranatra chinensis TaxID=642074 RepID=A0ABD0YF62_9HEMI